MVISGWFGFWIFLSVWLFVDYKMYIRGHDTLFFSHVTPEEKKIQENIIKGKG